MPLDRPGYVYVMRRRSDGVRKIGFSINPKNRRRELIYGYGQMDIEITWKMSERASWFVESHAHGLLRTKRYIEGYAMELYALPLREIIAAIREARTWARQHLPDGDLRRGWK